uniref:Uncharacterized protein n=1 Tax=uncultured Flavobacteriia bacterium TaxID=212695 RepID=H6RGE7_9BACT|nr:hypothetical protein VIS_S3CIB80029 [uncultured Flavobacteriia bacterium]
MDSSDTLLIGFGALWCRMYLDVGGEIMKSNPILRD